MILVIGTPHEVHSSFIHDKLAARGSRVAYLDTRLFPSQTGIALYPGRKGKSFLRYAEGSRIALADIQSVYWRCHMGTAIGDELDTPFLREMAGREIESCIGSMFRMMDECLWINSPEAIDMHVYKGYQLQTLALRSLRIPQTLITNDADALESFYECLRRKVIFKPVRGGAHTRRMSDDDLTPARLRELAQAPVQFQEMIEGVDIRVYVIGNEQFAAEIRSSTLDFREDPGAAIVPVELPPVVAADCIAVARALRLEMSGIDMRRTPAGEYVFLEGNPAPMFMHFEDRTGYPISDRLVDRLIAGR
jgi:glutathione synthase/RimK-type ligase-like ATP-grasp enzyme